MATAESNAQKIAQKKEAAGASASNVADPEKQTGPFPQQIDEYHNEQEPLLTGQGYLDYNQNQNRRSLRAQRKSNAPRA